MALDCDVAIVGAGIIGSAIAFELAGRGTRVKVLDSRPAGHGATQAAAGMLVPYIEGFGKPILKMGVRSLGMYDDFIARITSETGIAIEYKRNGSLQVSTEEQSDQSLRDLHSAARAANVACRLLDAHDVRELEPDLTPEIAGGLLISDHGFVVPTMLSHALGAAAVKRGAHFQTDSEQVLRISTNGDGLEVQTARGHLLARHVIVAAGSWSTRIKIEGIPEVPVRPVRGQLVQVSAPRPPSGRIIWGAGCYIAPSVPGTLSVGATVEEAGFDERVTVAGVRDLLDAATELIPALWGAAFAGARVGLRPATPDELPMMGRSKRLRGLVYATGHFRNGILLAPLTARVVADLVLENREDEVLEITSPQRFGEF